MCLHLWSYDFVASKANWSRPWVIKYYMSVIIYYVFSSGGSSGGGSGTTGEKTHALEQKVLKLMDELTELHRNKGEVC